MKKHLSRLWRNVLFIFRPQNALLCFSVLMLLGCIVSRRMIGQHITIYQQWVSSELAHMKTEIDHAQQAQKEDEAETAQLVQQCKEIETDRLLLISENEELNSKVTAMEIQIGELDQKVEEKKKEKEKKESDKKKAEDALVQQKQANTDTLNNLSAQNRFFYNYVRIIDSNGVYHQLSCRKADFSYYWIAYHPKNTGYRDTGYSYLSNDRIKFYASDLRPCPDCNN